MAQGIKPNYNFDIIREFIKQGKSTQYIADFYNINRISIGRVLKKEKIEFPGQRRVVVNHNFFENIDSEIKAYLLGFFVADGCVYDQHRIGLCIAEQDEYIVKLFTEHLAPLSFIKKLHNTKGAKNRQSQLFLRISSTKIVSDLAKLGIFERKTFKPMFIPKISNELRWHFIRGYFDGDGCLYIRPNKKEYTISLSNGDTTILKDIQQFSNFGKVRQQNNCGRLVIERKLECNSFLSNIYKNANFKLPRKFNKYQLVNTEVNNQITKG